MSAFDLYVPQRNSGDTGFDEPLISPAANSLLGFSAGKVVINVTIGTGLTLSSGVLSATGGGGGTWGSITGTLSDQTDLQTALNAKQNSITFGSGVLAALAVNIGSAGAPVLFNGAGGTPSSLVLTNATGYPLSSIAAAAASNTIANGNNTGQVWNWANTTNSTIALSLGETTAATNGNSTSGIPNQVLFKLSTLASSTMSPFQVYSRGTHILSVSPSTAQVFFNPGTASDPSIAFAGAASATGTGLYYIGTANLGIATGGANRVSISSTTMTLAANMALNLNRTTGVASAVDVSFRGDTALGFFADSSSNVAVSGGGPGTEIMRWTGGATTATGTLSVSSTLTASTTIELGNATDTTLARVSAGDVSIEGNIIYRAGGTDVAVADGGTGASTLTANNVLLGNGTSAVQFVAPGTSGNVLVSNGTTWTSAAPTVGNLVYPLNSGAQTFLDMPVTSASGAGTEQSYAFKIDGNTIFKIYAESDGAGGIQNAAIQVNGAQLNLVIETVAAGTAYTMTTSYATLDFGTTDPTITLTAAGTYLLMAEVQTALVGATITTQTVSFKLRRTNNTAADVGSVFSAPLPVSTAGSPVGPSVAVICTKYATANANDVIALQGLLSAATGGGTVTATDARIIAVRLF